MHSATMKGIVNHRRAVDLLASLPEVDPRRIGVIGHSLGGHNSLFVAAFDPRIKRRRHQLRLQLIREILRRQSHRLESQRLHAAHRRAIREIAGEDAVRLHRSAGSAGAARRVHQRAVER